MGRFAKEPAAGADFEEAPPGTHLGVCFRVIDLGTQHQEFQGEETVRSQVLISWELPEETMADGRPFAVSRFYTNSLHEKATLRKDLAAWRGRDFTQEELAGFDLASILGKACLVSVSLNAKGKSKVGAVLAVPKGTKAKPPANPLQAFFIDEWDDAVFANLPKGIRAIIQKSDEYQSRLHDRPPDEDEPPRSSGDEDDDNIPF